MPEEKEFIKKRGSYKGRLTMFVSYINSLDPASLTVSDISELQLRLGKIETIYNQFDEIQTCLECLDELDIQLQERMSFESQYFACVVKAQQIIEQFQQDDNRSKVNETVSHINNHKLVKLPTIQLPKFSGSYNNWLEFRDTFTSLIHLNDEIDEINKFHYLRASLEGTAAVVIQSIEFLAKNYVTAWTLLCERFDNKRLLVQHHVSALFHIELITKESSLVLKRVVDQINKNIRALSSLGEPTEHWDTLLIYIITQKLDPKAFRDWEELKGRLDRNQPIKLKSLLDFIRNRADLLETLESSHHIKPSVNNNNNNLLKPSRHKAMITCENVETIRSPSSTSSTKLCPACNGEHNLSDCSHFLSLSIDARLKVLPNFKICYNCFHKGHYAHQCKKSGCKICKRKHHTLIHLSDYKTKQIGHRKDGVGGAHASNQPSTSGPDNGIVLSTSVTSPLPCVQQEVLLSTALIKLCDKNDHEIIARVILDSGSTSCIITERLCNKLNIHITEIDKSLMGVNSVMSHVGKMCTVSIKSLNNKYTTNLQ